MSRNVAVGELNRRRALLVSQISAIDATLAILGAKPKSGRTRVTTGERTPAQKAAIAKAQAARRASVKATKAPVQSVRTQRPATSPIAQARAKRAAAAGGGASLAEAAE